MIVCAIKAHMSLLQNYSLVQWLHCLLKNNLKGERLGREDREKELESKRTKNVIAYQLYYHNCFLNSGKSKRAHVNNLLHT